MSITTRLPGVARYTMRATLRDVVLDFLGEYAEDYDVDELVDAYRAGVNESLTPHGVCLRGEEFYATVPVADGADELVTHALDAVDLGALAQEHDRTAYVVTFDGRPVHGVGALNGLRRMSLSRARALVAFATPERTGRVIRVDSLEEV